MSHHTKDKGDLACLKAMARLAELGYAILVPAVSEHLPFDIVGYKDGYFTRFQSKYASDGCIDNQTTWASKQGNHLKVYAAGSFEYYAIYIPAKDCVCFPNFSFGGAKLTFEVPNSATPFYWYEDFLGITDSAKKKTYHDFGVELTNRPSGPRLECRKVVRPSAEELQKLVWSKSTKQVAKDFGVSDKAIEKWVKAYNITKPPRGYWAKKQAGKL